MFFTSYSQPFVYRSGQTAEVKTPLETNKEKGCFSQGIVSFRALITVDAGLCFLKRAALSEAASTGLAAKL